MKYPLLIILLVLLPLVTAFPIQVNTSVTIDWIGNNQAYLRTESGDYLFDVNSSSQTDRTYSINLTRETGTNQSDFDIVMDKLDNITDTCSLLQYQLNYTSSFQQELLINYSRCSLDKEALMAEVPVLESSLYNMSNNASNLLTICYSQKDTLGSAYDGCAKTLANVTSQLTLEQSSNSQKTVILVIAGIVGVVLFINELQRRAKASPDEAAMLSQQ